MKLEKVLGWGGANICKQFLIGLSSPQFLTGTPPCRQSPLPTAWVTGVGAPALPGLSAGPQPSSAEKQASGQAARGPRGPGGRRVQWTEVPIQGHAHEPCRGPGSLLRTPQGCPGFERSEWHPEPRSPRGGPAAERRASCPGPNRAPLLRLRRWAWALGGP